MGIIVDTGIVLEIIATHPEEDMHNAMLSWIKDMVGKILPPCPRGKRVTMFISSGVYNDYKAKMTRGGNALIPKWHIVRKLQFTRDISDRNRLVFTIQLVDTNKVDSSDWDGDRFDKPFYELLEAVRQRRAWADRRIIFASKDKDTYDRMRGLMTRRETSGRMHFADCLSACEELVMC